MSASFLFYFIFSTETKWKKTQCNQMVSTAINNWVRCSNWMMFIWHLPRFVMQSFLCAMWAVKKKNSILAKSGIFLQRNKYQIHSLSAFYHSLHSKSKIPSSFIRFFVYNNLVVHTIFPLLTFYIFLLFFSQIIIDLYSMCMHWVQFTVKLCTLGSLIAVIIRLMVDVFFSLFHLSFPSFVSYSLIYFVTWFVFHQMFQSNWNQPFNDLCTFAWLKQISVRCVFNILPQWNGDMNICTTHSHALIGKKNIKLRDCPSKHFLIFHVIKKNKNKTTKNSRQKSKEHEFWRVRFKHNTICLDAIINLWEIIILHILKWSIV